MVDANLHHASVVSNVFFPCTINVARETHVGFVVLMHIHVLEEYGHEPTLVHVDCVLGWIMTSLHPDAVGVSIAYGLVP